MRRRQALAALAGSGCSLYAQAGPVQKERAEVPTAAPVTIGGVRYEAPQFTRTLGLPHNGGFVIAYDAASNARLWTAAIYGLSGSPQMEQDKREVFIVELRPDRDGRHLIVTDERARRWRLDLQTRHVTRLKSP